MSKIQIDPESMSIQDAIQCAYLLCYWRDNNLPWTEYTRRLNAIATVLMPHLDGIDYDVMGNQDIHEELIDQILLKTPEVTSKAARRLKGKTNAPTKS